MKKLYVLFILTLFSLAAFSQGYKEKMKKNIQLFESSNFIKAANGFESVALSEKKEWLPFYYAGLCHVLVAFQKPKNEIDALCDKADVFARKADSLSKNNSEVLVLKSMIAAARINVNHVKRGQKYGMMATKFANEAIKLNSDNPRAYFVKAQATLYAPPAFGGGEKKAKPIFEMVLEKASRQGVIKPESNLHPNWGKAEAEQELKKINNKTKK